MERERRSVRKGRKAICETEREKKREEDGREREREREREGEGKRWRWGEKKGLISNI